MPLALVLTIMSMVPVLVGAQKGDFETRDFITFEFIGYDGPEGQERIEVIGFESSPERDEHALVQGVIDEVPIVIFVREGSFQFDWRSTRGEQDSVTIVHSTGEEVLLPPNDGGLESGYVDIADTD